MDSYDSAWLSLVGMLAVIVVIVALAWWTTRLLGKQMPGAGAFRGGHLKALDRLRLGKDQQLVVVQAGPRYFLLGVGVQSVSMLAELTPEEAACWRKPPEEAGESGSPPDFKEAFLQALQKRKQR